MKKNPQAAVVYIGLILGLLILILNLAGTARASYPEDDSGQENGPIVGLASTVLERLAVDNDLPGEASGVVKLIWQGQVERARLVLSVAGTEAAHTIKVNGRPVALAPIRPGGQLCSAEEYIYLDIPPEVLVRGDNLIEITDDALPGDSWSAANLYLEIHGVLSGPPVAVLEAALPTTPSPSEMDVMAVVSDSVVLTSSYDGIPQVVWYQIPDGYTGDDPTPLVIGVHGYYGSGEDARDFLAPEANERGWLLAAPDMHGQYYVNHGWHALAWPGAQHDIIDTVRYMMSNYNVDTSRIYIAGGSMGGQTTAVMAAKYPDVFAAAAPWKPFTDLTDWYIELDALGDQGQRLEQIRNETGGTPSEVPFEYQRRSAMEMPQNSRSIPIKMWHDVDDILVKIHHSHDLKNAINSWNPITSVILIEIASGENECPTNPYEHCYDPDLPELFDYLAGFTLSSQPPPSLTIRTDESKPYYWLNVAQTGGDHWSQVEASYNLVDKTVTATISDTHPLTVAFNLGSTPLAGTIKEQPGMGLPATTYLVEGGGNNYLHNYTSGYLITTLASTGQFALTISAIEAEVSANPPMVSGWQTATSTITAVVQDRLNNPIPDDTIIQFSTTEGTFPNGSSTLTKKSIGGQATTILTLGPSDDLAEIIASIESITGSTSIDVIHPALDVAVTPHRTTIYSGQAITYSYQISNSGDITLTGVTLVDDNGTPGDSSDDITVCEDVTLAAGATTSYSRSATLTQPTANTVAVTGQDPLSNDVSNSDSTTVNVISPTLEVAVTPNQTTICRGQAVTYTYRFTNSGDTRLTDVTLVDDNGTPGDSNDDITVCEDVTLTAGATTSCSRSATLTQTTTNTVAVTGQDPLSNDVSNSDSTTVNVISPTLEVVVTPYQTTIYSGQAVTYTYQISNSGDVTLTGVTLVDDNGTPGDSSDDVTVCEDVTLAAGATASYSRSATLTQTTTNTVAVTGQDPLGNDVTRSDSATVNVISPTPDVKIYLPFVTRNTDSIARSVYYTRYHARPSRR